MTPQIPNTSPCILDLSHFQTPDFHAIYAAGIRAVILKCTQGASEVDPDYQDFKARALSVGLLVGAYHFLTSDNAVDQTLHFLSESGKGIVPALDWEQNGVDFNTADAFAMQIVNEAGRHPLCYGSPGYLTGKVLGGSVLSACPLWLAEYGPVAHVPFPFLDWSIWQYADNAVTGSMTSDGDLFHRPVEELAAWWADRTI